MDAEPTALEIACEGALRDHTPLNQQLKASMGAGGASRLEEAGRVAAEAEDAPNAARVAIERYRAR